MGEKALSYKRKSNGLWVEKNCSFVEKAMLFFGDLKKKHYLCN
jgi:hypothetical protein